MSSLEKKSNKNTTTTEKPLLNKWPVLSNLSLPDDLLLSCIAHVSRLYYPSLSLVSKSFKTLLASPELYKTRSLLNRTESCLYMCLRFPPDPNLRWFTLCWRPDQVLTNEKKLRSNILVPVPITSPHSAPHRSTVVAVGSDIYEIGGLINGVPSSSVSILDCRYNSWHKAPNMHVARELPFAVSIDGKILVKGGDLDDTEVFDPKSQTWEIVSSGEWESPKHYGDAWQSSCRCVIDNVLYTYRRGKLLWSDNKARDWKIVKGMKGLLPKFIDERKMSCGIQLVDYGGKMAFLWGRHDLSNECQGMMISCAVINLERCSNSEEISGTVEWSDAVLKVPERFAFVHVVAATV